MREAVRVRYDWHQDGEPFTLIFRTRRASTIWPCGICEATITRGALHASRLYDHICLDCAERHAVKVWEGA